MCPVRPSEGVCTRRARPSPHHRSHIKHYELLSGQRRANQPALAAGRAREAHMQAGGVAHQGESVDYARSGRRSGRCVHQSGLSRGPERQRAGRRRAGAGELWGGERAPKWPLGSLYRRAKQKSIRAAAAAGRHMSFRDRLYMYPNDPQCGSSPHEAKACRGIARP